MELVGQILKKNREIKVLSLKDVSNDLNISESILNNLENNNVDEDIDIIFLLGHLRSYCSYMDLNHQDLVNKFKKQSIPQKIINFEIQRPKIEKNFLYSNKIFSFSLIVIIFSSFYFLFIDKDKSRRDYAIIPDLPENYIAIIEEANVNSSKKKNIVNENLENIAELESITSSSSAIASLPQKKNHNTALITLKILDPTWLQLRNKNNDIILSQLMNKNEEYSYDSDLNYSITSGNAGHILVLINQKVRGKIGKKGQVVDSLILDNNFNN